MVPNLQVGDHLLVNKFVYGAAATAWERRWLPLREPRAGDVVVFRFPADPTRDFVKRVVGEPGATVAMERRQVTVDGLVLDEPWVYHSDPRAYSDSALLPPFYRRRDNLAPVTVPPRSYFVLGDNRDQSEDSRSWGHVPRDYVKGRALAVYWSRAGSAGAGEEDAPTSAGALPSAASPAPARGWPRWVR
jgi:signal peptidase I